MSSEHPVQPFIDLGDDCIELGSLFNWPVLTLLPKLDAGLFSDNAPAGWLSNLMSIRSCGKDSMNLNR